MRGWLAIVVVSIALMPMSVWAQRRGTGAAPRPAMGGHFSALSRPNFASHTQRFRGTHPGSPFFHRGFNHHRFSHRRFGFGWPYYYSSYLGYYPSYPLFGNTYGDSADNQQNYAASQELNPMSAEVQRLREEVAELRSRPSVPPPQPQAQSEAVSTPTTLVLRNGNSEQVQNYAITGQTILVFDKQRMTKIPLSELDVPATKAANEERGVSFQIPSSKLIKLRPPRRSSPSARS